ncbi:uncharacterized protein [Salminus brasiliensis]|uniref:uncharacterized protein isoform X3 n=1 Tax=Salminus brasiliensis TaxID=930266 RepID=UPI003B82DADD
MSATTTRRSYPLQTDKSGTKTAVEDSKRKSLLKDNSWINKDVNNDKPVDQDSNFGRTVLSRFKSAENLSSSPDKTTSATTTTKTSTTRPEKSSVQTLTRRFSASQDELDSRGKTQTQPRLTTTDSPTKRTSRVSKTETITKTTPKEPTAQDYSKTVKSVTSPTSTITRTSSVKTEPKITSTDKLRRSMPNLIRAPSMLSVPSVPSVVAPASPATAFPSFSSSSSALRSSQSFDSSSGLARLQTAIPSPGQLQQRVQSIGNFSMATRQPLKATAYVSPTIQGPTTMPSSVSLNSLSSSGIPLPSKPSTSASTSRSALPRPASFIGTTGTARSKIAQPVRSLLTPPKSMAALSALRDASWKDGCY